MIPFNASQVTFFRALCRAIAASLLIFAVSAHATDATPSEAQPAARAPADASVDKVDTEKLFNAIVKVKTVAVPSARSNATLGREREGTGVVIGDNGLVLTIGYLIVEADDVKITDAQGRDASRRGRRLRPRHGSGPGAQRRSDERGAGAAGRFRPHVASAIPC